MPPAGCRSARRRSPKARSCGWKWCRRPDCRCRCTPCSRPIVRSWLCIWRQTRFAIVRATRCATGRSAGASPRQPAREVAVEFGIQSAEGVPLPDSVATAVSDLGVAAGEFQLPPEVAAGRYLLVAQPPGRVPARPAVLLGPASASTGRPPPGRVRPRPLRPGG